MQRLDSLIVSCTFGPYSNLNSECQRNDPLKTALTKLISVIKNSIEVQNSNLRRRGSGQIS